MTASHRISIAMPVRDAARWLGDCVASVLAQTESRFELLAVDDGSRDDSRALLDELASRDRRIVVLATDPAARGIASALNLALRHAGGQYLARMDADDVMHPRRLELQAASLDEDASLFAVACRARGFPDDDLRDGMRAYLEWQNALLQPGDIARDRFIESPVLHPTAMLRTAVVRDVLGGWRDLEWPEDWDFFLRAFEAGLRIARLPECLLDWRIHPAQATRVDARYSLDALLELRAEFLSRRLALPAHEDRALWVLGAGPVGKSLVKALARRGVVAHGLADVDPRKIGGVVRGAGQRWHVVEHRVLRAMNPRPFAVSAVSGAAARSRVRGELRSWGWSEGVDFIVAA